MIEVFTVVNIYRIYGQSLSFIIALHNKTIEYFDVDRSLSERVSKGMVFIGDRVVISNAMDDGIIFEVLKDDQLEMQNADLVLESEVQFYYTETSKKISSGRYAKRHYLPYLCDVLPYNNVAVEEAKASPVFKNNVFQGKYVVNGMEVSNIRTSLPSMFIAKIHQKTRINTYPTSFNPFFFIIVSSNNIFLKVVFWSEHLKDFSSLRVGDVIMVKDYRIKRKWAFIDKADFNTFTESVYFDCDEISAKDLVRIRVDKKGLEKCLFDTVEGCIEYLSVLMRYNCNGTLMEYVLVKIGGESVMLFYNSDTEFYSIRPKSKMRIKELRKTKRAGFEFYVSTIYTQFELLEDPGATKRAKTAETCVFGAMGYIPDAFPSMSDITEYESKEVIHNQEVSFGLFMRPQVILLEDLKKQCLLLNETRKFLITGCITDVLDTECTIDYTEDEANKKQKSFTIVLDGQIECRVYENFFDKRLYCFGSLQSKNDFVKVMSRKMHFVIEGFRADEDTVLYYLTGVPRE